MKLARPFLYVGLDFEKTSDVIECARELARVDRNDFGLKLNQDFLMRENGQAFQKVLNLGLPVFADLKMWNGARTMMSTAQYLADKGVRHLNIYAHAGVDFLRSVTDKLKGSKTEVLGVTVLTHYDEDYCKRVYECSLGEAVGRLANIAYEGGCQGVILPGTQLEVVRSLPIDKLVPAVRPRWYGKTGENYQEQESFVDDVIRGGGTILVCSSPIRKSPDRINALSRTLTEMLEATPAQSS